MCSILGQISLAGNLINQNKFIQASDVLRHRGPDKKKYLSDNNHFQFAFNRLSIIDLNDSGDQPMVSDCGRYICVFNGEIYNHKSIFEEIKEKFQWRGNSDTEVLVNAWSLYKEKVIKKLDGMFSFAIWDKNDAKLTIVRDRIGEKPLYYYLDNQNSLFFTSRPEPIKFIFPNLRKELNEDSVTFYFESGYLPRNKSINNKIFKLEPGCYLEFKENKIKINNYWSVNNFFPKNTNNKTLKTYVAELDELLRESIYDRLISDRPLGFLLSGGLDSSLIVAISSTMQDKKNLKVFNLGFDNKAYDESEDAKLVTNSLGINLIKEKLNANDLIKLTDIFFEKFDEPFSDSACFPLMAISKFAKNYVDVVITGDGGDELFGGYHYYHLMNLYEKFEIIFTFLRYSKLTKTLKLFNNHKIKLFMNFIEAKNSMSRFSFIRSARKDFPSVLNKITKYSLQNSYLSLKNKMQNDNDVLSQVMKLDIQNTLNDNYLQKTDLSSMAFSLESRAPFLSKKIIEWSLQIPTKYKVNLFEKKIIIKELAKKYLPNEIVNKKKKGFEPPIKDWLKKDLKDWSLDLIKNDKNYKGLNLDKSKIIDLFNLHLSGKRDCHPYLWTILMMLKFNEKENTYYNYSN